MLWIEWWYVLNERGSENKEQFFSSSILLLEVNDVNVAIAAEITSIAAIQRIW